MGESGAKGTLSVSLWVSNSKPKHLSELCAKYDILTSIMMQVLGSNDRVVCPTKGRFHFLKMYCTSGCGFLSLGICGSFYASILVLRANLPQTIGTWHWAFLPSGINSLPRRNLSSWWEFAWCYKVMRSPEGHHFFQAQDGRVLFYGLPSDNKGWQERFFLISGQGWEYPPDEKDPATVQNQWGVPSTQYKFAALSYVCAMNNIRIIY